MKKYEIKNYEKQKQKLKVKNTINEYDDLIKQYKNNLVIKKRQHDKLIQKYNEIKNYFENKFRFYRYGNIIINKNDPITKSNYNNYLKSINLFAGRFDSGTAIKLYNKFKNNYFYIETEDNNFIRFKFDQYTRSLYLRSLMLGNKENDYYFYINGKKMSPNNNFIRFKLDQLQDHCI